MRFIQSYPVLLLSAYVSVGFLGCVQRGELDCTALEANSRTFWLSGVPDSVEADSLKSQLMDACSTLGLLRDSIEQISVTSNPDANLPALVRSQLRLDATLHQMLAYDASRLFQELSLETS